MHGVQSIIEVNHKESNINTLSDDYVIDYVKRNSFIANPHFLLRLESHVLSCAYANNKMLSLSNSRTRILPHQIESTYTIVNSIQKRFLIADEVGLGKTIEAGLVIKELGYRYNYTRVCIVCPASLLLQWQHEMKSKFNEECTIVDRKTFSVYNGNPWKLDKVICSIDFIKNPRYASTLQNIPWDVVVIDEAHRLRKDATTHTQAYQVAEILARNSKALILLSATPFRGKLEELYFLISLLDKNLLGPFQHFQSRFCVPDADLTPLKERLASVVIRRTKREVGGFTKRFAKTICFELYPEERLLYDATTEYVAYQYNKALQTENRAIGFVMTVFQKLLDSSSYALASALTKRYQYLKALKDSCAMQSTQIEEIDEEEEDIDTIVTVESLELDYEIATLEKLIALARTVTRNKKADKLLQLIKKLKKEGHEKVIIFTQFRSTQDYLAHVLKDYRISLFHGSLTREEKERAIMSFKEFNDILICTEAGGEGRNLQFCNVLINYDLPWSPLKVEQRIGRIHRFGQTSNVIIYNFSTKNTVAERVLDVLTRKLRLFEESLGTPDVILGDITDERFFNKIFMELITNLKSKRNFKKVNKEIDTYLERARESYQKLHELTVAKKMDLNFDEYYRVTLQEREYTNTRIEQFVTMLRSIDDTLKHCIGESHSTNKLYYVKYNPVTGHRINKYGTFNSQLALENEMLEFLAFGHPIVDWSIARCKEPTFGGLSGIKVIYHPIRCVGVLFNYLVTCISKEMIHHVVPVVVTDYELTDSQLEEIEQEVIRQPSVCEPIDDSIDVKSFSDNIYHYYYRSKIRLNDKVQRIVQELKETMALHIDTVIERTREHYMHELEFMHKRLEWQQCQQKWYGKDMQKALGRTKNKIQRIEEEKQKKLAEYSSYTAVTWEATLINVGVIICKQRLL